MRIQNGRLSLAFILVFVPMVLSFSPASPLLRQHLHLNTGPKRSTSNFRTTEHRAASSHNFNMRGSVSDDQFVFEAAANMWRSSLSRRAALFSGLALVTVPFQSALGWELSTVAEEEKKLDEWGYEEKGDGSMEDLGLKRQRVSDAIKAMKKKYKEPLSLQPIRDNIQQAILEDPDFGPTLIRLAWHSSGTYSRIANNGGSNGGTIRFKEELNHEANAGLKLAVQRLENIKKNHAEVSYADLYTLAGAVAVETLGGPAITWRMGRKDAPDARTVTENGRLPDADKGDNKSTAAHLRSIFGRMGFNDQEIVALSGAHAVGECHKEASGYVGPWTTTPNIFNNLYFQFLVKLKWEPHSDFGKVQYRAKAPLVDLMMLPSDIALLEDEKFSVYVRKYASDQDAWYQDFKAAFEKLLELGTTDLK